MSCNSIPANAPPPPAAPPPPVLPDMLPGMMGVADAMVRGLALIGAAVAVATPTTCGCCGCGGGGEQGGDGEETGRRRGGDGEEERWYDREEGKREVRRG